MTKDSPGSDLEQIGRNDGLLPMLRAALRSADAIATGAIGAGTLPLLMIPGRLVQAARNGEFIEHLGKEFERLRSAGAIKPDFERSEDGKATLQELLAALEEPPVEAVKFGALKAVFLAAAANAGPSHAAGTPQLLMSIVRQLSPGEVIVLATTHQISKEGSGATNVINRNDAQGWLGLIASRSGMRATSLVEHYEETLMTKRLLTPRTYSDRSGVNFGSHFRLTDLGVTLCEFILTGESLAGSRTV